MALAGLGEKRFALFLYSDPKELTEQILENFPKLAAGGGYEFLRSGERGGRMLVPLEVPPGGYNVEFLKAVISSAKIYIRPMQKDLDLSVTKNVRHDYMSAKFLLTLAYLSKEACSNMQECLNCGVMFPMDLLKNHLLRCRK